LFVVCALVAAAFAGEVENVRQTRGAYVSTYGAGLGYGAGYVSPLAYSASPVTYSTYHGNGYNAYPYAASAYSAYPAYTSGVYGGVYGGYPAFRSYY
jgi:hypothetical protein